MTGATAGAPEPTPAAAELAALLIFLFTFALISGRRFRLLPLSRPSAALIGAVAMVGTGVLTMDEAFAAVDWNTVSLLLGMLTMSGERTDLPQRVFRAVTPLLGERRADQALGLTWFSALGSNVVSNVPFVLIAGPWIPRLADPELLWKVLAMATTFAGNLTILGSVANIIVVEMARPHLEVGFWDYARYGIPITLLTLGAGLGMLLACGPS